MTKRTPSTAALAAKAIRKHLKAQGVKAKVTCENYSGGNSVDVDLLEDYNPAIVKLVEDYCKQYQRGHFNSMEDIYEYSNTNRDIPQVQFVFVKCVYSDAIRDEAHAYYCYNFNTDGMDDFDIHMASGKLLNKVERNGFWASRKVRVRAA